MANAGSDALLRIRELCVSACRQTGCNFVLDDVPVRSEKTVLETKNVDDDLSDRRVPRTPMVSLHKMSFIVSWSRLGPHARPSRRTLYRLSQQWPGIRAMLVSCLRSK
jgi:hypothetical protein